VNVVIVEDVDHNRDGLAMLLRAEGHDVEALATGLDVTQRLVTGPVPDAVILDKNLPELGGLEVLRLMRETRGWGGVPVVLITAEDVADLLRRMRRDDHPFCVLGKPFDMDQLRVALADAKRRAEG
jgi:two-component system, OmpR family, response regulator